MAGQDPAQTLMMFFNIPVPTAWLKWVLHRTLCWQLWQLCSIWETLKAQVVLLLISEQWLERKEIFRTVMMYGLKNDFVNSLYWNWLNSASSYLLSFSIPYTKKCHFYTKKVTDPGTKKVQFEKYEALLKTLSKWINSISHKWKRIAKKDEQERTAFLSLSEWCNNTSANQQDTGTQPIKGGWNHQRSQLAPCSFTCHLRQSCTE